MSLHADGIGVLAGNAGGELYLGARMFTGLVEHIGTVEKLELHDTTESGGGGCSLVVSNAAPILDDCKLGDSIAVNGVSLRSQPA